MSSCSDIELLITAYVDNEATSADRGAVDIHVLACPPCRGRLFAEQATRELILARACGLTSTAPPPLRARCLAAAPRPFFKRFRSFSTRHTPAVSAAVVAMLAVAAVVVWGLLDQSGQALATQLTLDHLKCFATLGAVTTVDPESVQNEFASRYGVRTRVPGSSAAAHLSLVGARRCFSSEGQVAHILYKHDGQPISIFLLPHRIRLAHDLEIMGHKAVIWSRGDMTYIVVGPRREDETEQVAKYMKAALY